MQTVHGGEGSGTAGEAAGAATGKATETSAHPGFFVLSPGFCAPAFPAVGVRTPVLFGVPAAFPVVRLPVAGDADARIKTLLGLTDLLAASPASPASPAGVFREV